MKAYAVTDVGRSRSMNQDSVFASVDPVGPLSNLYMVADGMGGHNAGEIASQSAIKYFNEYIENNCVINDGSDVLDAFVDALGYSNSKIFEMSENDPSYSGMGTTFTAAAICGGKIYCVHIGDSRLYVYDRNGLRQITRDHSFVMEMVRMGKITAEEARVHPKRNMITKAVGIEKNMPADTMIIPIEEDSIILVCSDGLPSMVTDKEIEKILKKKTGLDKKADLLVELANKNGGYDNISVILADGKVDN